MPSVHGLSAFRHLPLSRRYAYFTLNTVSGDKPMSKKNLFRSVLDAMIESRQRQAAREIAIYSIDLRDESDTKRGL
jgi:hypothetical protein